MDGVQTVETSGEPDWETYTFTATADKTYTFKWSYEKDDWDFSQWVGAEDAAYVDDIAYSGTQPGLMGDVNGDGSVDVADALLTLRYSMELIGETALELNAADMDGNGMVTVSDALTILRIAMGLI